MRCDGRYHAPELIASRNVLVARTGKKSRLARAFNDGRRTRRGPVATVIIFLTFARSAKSVRINPISTRSPRGERLPAHRVLRRKLQTLTTPIIPLDQRGGCVLSTVDTYYYFNAKLRLFVIVVLHARPVLAETSIPTNK